MAVLIGEPTRGYKTRTLIVLVPRQRKRPYLSWELVCFGPKRHYAKDGTCAHTDVVLTALKSDWHRKRTHVIGWGNQPPQPEAEHER